MYRVTILVAVIITLYVGKVHCCGSTYISDSTAIANQYSGSIIQCYNDKCNKAMQQLFKAADSTLDKRLPTIVNRSTFKFNPKVSYMHNIANGHFNINIFTGIATFTKQ